MKSNFWSKTLTAAAIATAFTVVLLSGCGGPVGPPENVLRHPHTLLLDPPTPTSSGSIRVSDNHGLSEMVQGAYLYNVQHGTSVTFTAEPAAGYTFSHWTGASISTARTITLTVNSNITISAVFMSTTCTLTTNTSPAGIGSITRSPNRTTYDAGTAVTLTANAPAGYRFENWTISSHRGTLTSPQNPSTITINAYNTTATANFVLISTPPDTTVTPPPPDTTIVTPPPPDTTVTPPPPDTTIVIPPPPDTTIVTPPPPDTTVTPPPPTQYSLTVNTTGNGTVSHSPTGTSFPEGTVVTLTANPAAGHTFERWTGASTSTTSPVQVTINANTTITAVFAAIPPPPPTGTNTGTPCTEWYMNNSSAERFEIAGADQLAGLAQLVNGGINFDGKTVALANDIDLSVYGRGYNRGQGWIPIGREHLTSFWGVFDGNKKKMTGLFIDDITLGHAGLFAYVRVRSTIRNLGLQDVNINGGELVGGLAASATDSRIENCYVTGTIIGTRTAGGLIASLTHSQLTDSYSTANVTGTGNVGGLVGSSGGFFNIIGCYSTGEVRSTGSSSSSLPLYTAGGLVGYGTGGSITRNATLNSNIISAQSQQSTGRIGGWLENSITLAGNIAFNGMTLNTAITTGTATNKNGTDITAATIRSDGTIGGLFTSANGWTTQSGRLPGLFGETVEMPPHLR